MKHIEYSFDLELGVYNSRLVIDHTSVAYVWSVLEFDKIGEGGDFTQPPSFHLEYMDVRDDSHARWSNFTSWVRSSMKYTKKVPLEVRNEHRALYGMKPVKENKHAW